MKSVSSSSLASETASAMVASVRMCRQFDCREETNGRDQSGGQAAGCGLAIGSALSLVAALDEKLKSFSGESYSEDWEASALEKSRNWAEVRSIAKELLDALG
jgi:hypothetical protein